MGLWSSREQAKEAVSAVDLRSLFPPVYTQGQMGSCTANAWAGLIGFVARKQGLEFAASRLFIYYRERELANNEFLDTGANLQNGVKVLRNDGVCSEQSWPYNKDLEFWAPTLVCEKEAAKNKILQSHSVPATIPALKESLLNKKPFVFGFAIYDNFLDVDFSKDTMLMPTELCKQTGEHAVVAVGFDEEKQAFLIRNSWGPSWGVEGHFWMPYEFIEQGKYAHSFWTIDEMIFQK